MNPTIYALATPLGRSGVAVVRVSGPDAWCSLSKLTTPLPLPRMAALRTLTHPASGQPIDRALILAFKGPGSFTGEDIVEYHLHGGRAVISGLLDALAIQLNHRLATPGEFTRRAFENGRMDLTEAEAIADLIDAETELQKEQALLQMRGALKNLYDGWAERLTHALAHLEADIDFPDEDLPGGVAAAVRPALQTLKDELAAHLSDNRRGERLRGGIRIAVLGAPNAGKSSLVNAIARRDIAIVSDLAGTTRDVIEAHLDLGGYPVILSDTAGLRPEQLNQTGHEGIEAEGMRRARAAAESADLRLLVYDASALPARDAHTLALQNDHTLSIYNKADLQSSLAPDGILVSARTGAGMQDFIARLTESVAALVGRDTSPPLTRERHRAALADARDALDRALGAALPELLAEDVRLAVRALGRITGRVDVEDLLDRIFRDFCIGK